MARKLTKRQVVKQDGLNLEGYTALYIRVSTERQAQEGNSLAAQEKRLRDYCSAHGWNVSEDHIYIDAGVSGKTTDRERFQAMMQAAKEKKIVRAVAVKLDRVARNTKDFLATVETLQKDGCSLALIEEGFDTGTPQGKFAITMFAAMAELEASMISERVSSGRKENAAKGGYNGSRCPLGYKHTAEGFTVDSSAAETVVGIFNRFIDGQNMSKIAADLNADSVPTALGGKWYASTIRTILLNGFYAGLAQWGDESQPGHRPHIISRELYDQAQSRLDAIRPGPSTN